MIHATDRLEAALLHALRLLKDRNDIDVKVLRDDAYAAINERRTGKSHYYSSSIIVDGTVFTYENNFNAFVQQVATGEKCEIDEEMYIYFREVVPPRYPGTVNFTDGSFVKCEFTYGEGADPRRAFWSEEKEDGTVRYFARQVPE